MKKHYLLLLFIFIIFNAKAQAIKYASGEIYNLLLRLQNTQTVLYIAAHPDDENTRLLSWLVNQKKCRAAYLSLTRGDGGQNLIGKEQGIPLGIVRTNELLEARKIDGAEQYFTRAYDFGYSKTSEETLTMWNEDSILSDMVWVIRSMQPDIIVTRFPTDKRAGHGHHSASAILAKKAVLLAADASKFAWQLSELETWQCPQLFWNTFVRAGEPVPDTLFSQPIGDYVPTLGRSTSEIAALARSMHKSQAFGTGLQRDKQNEYFETWLGQKPKQSILDYTNNKWKPLKNGAEIEKEIENIIANFQFTAPQKITAALLQVYNLLENLPNNSIIKIQKQKIILQLLQACNGLYMEVTTNKQNLTIGDTCTITPYCTIRNDNTKVVVDSIIAFGKTIYTNASKDSLIACKGTKKNIAFTIPNTIATRQPYWLTGGVFQQQFVNDYKFATLTQPQHNEEFEATCFFTINGNSFTNKIPITYKLIDDEKGEVQQPLQIIPLRSVDPIQTVYPYGTKTIVFTDVDNKINNLSKAVQNVNGKTSVLLNITTPTQTFSNIVETINLYHIPTHTWQKPAIVKILEEPIAHSNWNVGYIAGTGDKIAEAMEMIGYNVTVLKEADMYPHILRKFKTIVIGIRAFSENKWLAKSHNQFLMYLNQGGTIIANYNSISDGEKLEIGPYPFAIGRKRITDEKATVTIKNSKTSLFTTPNKITNKDWDGWLQERSVYHPEQFDSTKYTTFIAMNDAGEVADETSLLACKYGKGVFVYNTLALFRQLPAGHTGAHKLLANLIEIKLP